MSLSRGPTKWWFTFWFPFRTKQKGGLSKKDAHAFGGSTLGWCPDESEIMKKAASWVPYA